MDNIVEITSLKNSLIKEVKSLYRKRNRWKNRKFIIEGIKIVEEALNNNVELKHIIYSNSLISNNEGKRLFNIIKDRDNIVKVTEEIFSEISDTESPQGVLGVVGFYENDLKDIRKIDNPSLLFLDEIQDPGNLGTIIRSGDAFNIDGIILGKGSVDPYNSKVIRSTMGSIFRIPIYISNDTLDCLKILKDMNINILATSLDGELIHNKSFEKGFVCIIGNESRGVSQEILSMVQDEIKIPMPGGAESLNAGVAASIIMYESMKMRL